MKISRMMAGAFALACLTGSAIGQTPQSVTIAEALTVSMPSGWRIQNQTRDSLELFVPAGSIQRPQLDKFDKNPKPEYVQPPDAGMLITIEPRRDHAEALKRLAEISVEFPEPAEKLLIAGWPAIERTYTTYMPQPGESESSVAGNPLTTFTTTAIAYDKTLVRFNTMYAPNARKSLISEAFGIARNMRMPLGQEEVSKRELSELNRIAPRADESRFRPSGAEHREPVRARGPGVPVQVQTGVGELEVATNDGQHVVVAANSGFSFSDNAGALYTSGGGTPCNQTRCDGDPSLAVGKSGAMYYAWIGGPSVSTLGDGLSRSTDNGHTFPFQAMMINCPGSTACNPADQEHIAADRSNAATGGGDRVYNVWRNFTATTFSIRIVCSANSGSTWGTSAVIGSGDFPRVAVAPDGFVYVAWASGGNMMLNKFSNCDAGLAQQTGWPVTVAAFVNVACPVAGLDRCNGRNILSSPVVAPDDLDSTHLYYSFATSSGSGNENVMIFDSSDSGATFPRSVQANSATTARRYLSWLSVYGGMATVSWYDRRNATAANNDLTRYFIGGAAVRGPNLVALAESDLSGTNDNQCSTWPWPTNATTDSESCSVQPQLAGYCAAASTTSPPAGYTPCDFSSTTCPTGQSCKFDRGAPKYGDYNGNAAGGGRMFSAWTSSVPPSGLTGTIGVLRVYSSADRIPSDFYVRDWNAGASFDNGQQPSTQADFWSTSDLWNQSTTTAETPGPDGSVAGDPPSRSGSNFLFARISRRAAAASTAPTATVTANFYVADYGLGTSFSAVGSESVSLAAADMTQITPAHSWTVPASASTHLCAAVQIAGPDGDVSGIGPLDGTSPGTGVLIDNNIAQRNLQGTVGTGAGTEIIAIARNWHPEPRQMQLHVRMTRGIRLEGSVAVLAADTRRGAQEIGIEDGRSIDLGMMKPGEVRWLRFHAYSLKNIDRPVAIEVADDAVRPANGFTIVVSRGSIEKVAGLDLSRFGDVLSRLGKVEGNPEAIRLAELYWKRSKEVSAEAYLAFLNEFYKRTAKIIETYQHAIGEDVFDTRLALSELESAIHARDAERASAAHNALTERLDAQLTASFYRKRETTH